MATKKNDCQCFLVLTQYWPMNQERMIDALVMRMPNQSLGIDLSMSMPWVWEQVRLKVRVVVTLALASRVMVHFSQSLWPVPSAWIWSGWFARPRTIRTLLPAAVVHSIYETWLFSSALGCCNARIRVKIMLPGFAFFSSGFHGGDW